MTTKRVLVLYASTHGHTGKIADRIGDVLRAAGVAARVRKVGEVAFDPHEFDAYIIAGSVHAGHHQRELIDDVLDQTGWTPDETLAVAGALQFEKYNLPTRVLMRLIARRVERRTEHDIDVHHDADYTDWEAVERFAEAFAAVLPTPASGVGRATPSSVTS